ncbi:MAG: hypothetical protein SCH71_05950 [Desulfobulbaceae bacterium]|nr:hypothetical protein [Desulfobulbaceae bacterium]
MNRPSPRTKNAIVLVPGGLVAPAAMKAITGINRQYNLLLTMSGK